MADPGRTNRALTRMPLLRGVTRSTLAVAATALLLALAVTNVARQVVSGVMDDGVLWGDELGRVVAMRVEEGGAGDRAGIEVGDALQVITDRSSGATIEVDSAADVRSVLDDASEGSRLRYVLIREGERRGMTLSVAPLPTGNVSLYLFLAAVGIFAGGVGTFVYAFRRGASASAHFYGLCLLWLLAFSFSFTGELDLFDHLFFWLDRIGVLFFPPVFLHFALTFPNRSRFLDRWPKLLHWAYAPSVALLGLSVGSRILYFSPFSPGGAVITGSEFVVDRLEPVAWALYSLAAFAAFVDAYRNAESVTVSKQLKWIVWGTGAGMLPFALIYAVPYLGGLPTTPEMELSLVPVVLVPLSFAYAIVKYRLMDVEVLFKRGILLASLMLGIAAIFLAAFLAGTTWFGGDEHSLIIAVLSAIVAALAVPAFRTRTERLIDRLFYREHYDFRRALARLAGEMNSQLDLVPLANRSAGAHRRDLPDAAGGAAHRRAGRRRSGTPGGGGARPRRRGDRRFRAVHRVRVGEEAAERRRDRPHLPDAGAGPRRRLGAERRPLLRAGRGGGRLPAGRDRGRRGPLLRGSGPAPHGGGAGGDRPRERAPLQLPPGQARGGGGAPGAERGHDRVARRRRGGARPQGPGGPLEPVHGAHLRAQPPRGRPLLLRGGLPEEPPPGARRRPR